MRTTLALSALIILLSLPVWAAGEKVAEAPPEKIAIENLKDMDLGNLFDACFGDRYESDDDINDGNRITEEEIRQIINPPRS